MRSHRDPQRTKRLDLGMVEQGLAPSRARARDLIRRGLVELAGAVERRPAARVGAGAPIRVLSGPSHPVSRGALKLAAALERFRFAVAGVVALDVGAATGGFTEVLLEAGARRVYAVDVGRGQLHARLRTHPRVVSMEGCDARDLDRARIPEPLGAIVADVSFISLTKALPVPLQLAADACWMVVLIKPQFEAGRSAVGKGGIVRDAQQRQRSVESVRAFVADAGWRVIDVMPSPIAGGGGNAEFLLGAERGRA